MIDPTLLPFFQPQGVVILGASREPAKLGYGLARNLLWSGYSGAIHFVNPKGGTLLGYPLYTRMAEVPDPVDLAVILTPPPSVPGMLAECGERGIRAAVIATGGFRESGPEGAALEERCLEVARKIGMRLVGPNCVGLVNTHLPLDTTFLPPPPAPVGEVAFISHSGAICAAVIDWVRGQGIGLSHLVSLGNQVDVTETDVLAPVAADRHTKVITLYLESVSNGPRFVEQARQAARQKPLVVLKVGRYESGKRAAASHTGALAGSDDAFKAAFRRAGVLRADNSEEMLQWARALAGCPLPQGRSVAVLTNAGGPGVTAADAIEQLGLRLAELQPYTRQTLQALLPAAASVQNPVDMLASATPELYARCLEILLEDPGVHSAMVITPPPPMFSAGQLARTLIPVIQTTPKPVIPVLMGERMVQEAVEHFRAAHIPEYRFPEAAASALSALVWRAESLARLDEQPWQALDADPERAHRVLSESLPGQFLAQEAANELMEAYCIPTVPPRLASSAAQAMELAESAGFPVALKVASPDIAHKSDVGGVLLNVPDAAAVARGFDLVTQNALRVKPGAQILGVHVQRMLPPGQEVIAGAVQDPLIGPLVMFGSGGVEVEGLKDVAFALAPLTRSEAEEMLEGTWAGRRLRGFRNLPPADRASVLECLLRLAQLAADRPELAEIEINPLRVLGEGQGAYAIDVRARKK